MRLVSLLDPALDIEKMSASLTLNAYMENRDETLVSEIPGKRLQWYVMRPIASSAWSSYVSVGASDSEQRRRAFIMGVEAIEDLHDNGQMRPGLTKGTQRFLSPTGERMVWSDREVDELFQPGIVEDIGEVARVICIVPLDYAGRLRPPPSSLAALLARVRLRVGALASNLEASGQAQEPRTSPPDGDGGAPTDAPATEKATSSQDEPATESPT